MGASAKTLDQIISLVDRGLIKPGANICDIGETQIFGDPERRAVSAFLSFFADKRSSPSSTGASGDLLLGDVLTSAGFKYSALDIFPGKNTILFDLNVHEPGPELRGQFDLVLNLGTTEHVFNQYRAFQSIHSLMKVDAICYHDLPMSGYAYHGLFRYDPMFFHLLAASNGYDIIERRISRGATKEAHPDLKEIGYDIECIEDVGIEFIVRRTNSDDFRIAMETTTSIGTEGDLNGAVSRKVLIPNGTSVAYAPLMPIGSLTRFLVHRVVQGLLRRL